MVDEKEEAGRSVSWMKQLPGDGGARGDHCSYASTGMRFGKWPSLDLGS